MTSSISIDTEAINTHLVGGQHLNERSEYRSEANLIEPIDDGASEEIQQNEISNLNFKKDIANSPLFVKDTLNESHS